jgi:hypothetical protein
MLEHNEKEPELLKLSLGNLMPGETAVIEITLLMTLAIEGSAYLLRIPTSYFPKYNLQSQDLMSLGSLASSLPDYSYAFNIELCTTSYFTYMSCPSHSTVVKH